MILALLGMIRILNEGKFLPHRWRGANTTFKGLAFQPDSDVGMRSSSDQKANTHARKMRAQFIWPVSHSDA